MIVDVHCHHFNIIQPDEVSVFLSTIAERRGATEPRDKVTDWYAAHIADLNTYDAFVRRMDEAGIDKAVLFYSDNMDNGNSEEITRGIHEHISKIAKRHPARIIPFASIDPRRPGAPDLFRWCIREYGMKGLKWHPDYGFYPNGEEAFEMLEVASELHVPLITHSGPLPGMRSKYAHPIHLDDVAYSFPDLPIIAAHMGDAWWRDWLALVQYKRNIYGDLAMWQFTAARNPSKFKAILREIIDSVGSGQILFGTDAPCFDLYISNGAFVDLMKSLADDQDDGIPFKQEEIDDILGGNASRLLDL